MEPGPVANGPRTRRAGPGPEELVQDQESWSQTRRTVQVLLEGEDQEEGRDDEEEDGG